MSVDWHVVMPPAKRQTIGQKNKLGALLDKAEKLAQDQRAGQDGAPLPSHQMLVFERTSVFIL